MADVCRFSVGGSTHGNQALALAVAQPGARVVVSRSLHRSLLLGLVLAGLEPVWVRPEVNPSTGLPTAVSVSDIEAALRAHPEARAVFLGDPSYVGTTGDIAGHARVAHAHGIPLIVDAAWAAHFGFHPDLPPHELAQGWTPPSWSSCSRERAPAGMTSRRTCSRETCRWRWPTRTPSSAMLTIADDDAGVDALTEALANAVARHRGSPRRPVVAAAWSLEPETVMAPREAFFAEHLPVPAREAVGRVSAELVAPYPPGVPVLAPGERVTRAALDSLFRARDEGARIAYAADPTLATLQVVAEWPQAGSRDAIAQPRTAKRPQAGVQEP